MGFRIIEPDSGVYCKIIVDGVPVHYVTAQIHGLEVWYDEAPAAYAVVLVFATDASLQGVLPDFPFQHNVGRISVLVETAFHCSVGLWHIAVADGF